jgi:hypothetical protein
MYCALFQFMGAISGLAAITHGPKAHYDTEAIHHDLKRQAGLARGEACKKQADEDWRDKALELAKKIQSDDPAVKPGMLKQKIKNKWPKNGKYFSDRQLDGAIRHWMKTGQLRHWKEKVQSPR